MKRKKRAKPGDPHGSDEEAIRILFPLIMCATKHDNCKVNQQSWSHARGDSLVDDGSRSIITNPERAHVMLTIDGGYVGTATASLSHHWHKTARMPENASADTVTHSVPLARFLYFGQTGTSTAMILCIERRSLLLASRQKGKLRTTCVHASFGQVHLLSRRQLSVELVPHRIEIKNIAGD